jgi:transposase
MELRELSDEQCQFIQPLLPPRARTGRPRADDRGTLNGILYVQVTGCRWMDTPKEYGSHKMAWRRLLELGYQAGRLKLGAVVTDATTIEARKGGRE